MSNDTHQYSGSLLDIRSAFSTWTAKRGMFETLNVFAQVRIFVEPGMDSLAAIYCEGQVYLKLHPSLVEHFGQDSEVCFFVLMHELRHLTQLRSQKDWSHFVNFQPLIRALLQYLPKDLAERCGLSEINEDFEYMHDIFNLAADAAIHEDIVRFFDVDIIQRVAELMKKMVSTQNAEGGNQEGKPGADVSPVTVALLEKIVQHPLEREKDWLYYARRMVDALALRISREPHLARLLVERQILRKLNKNGFAKVDLRDEDMMMLDQVFYCAAGESKKMIESYEKTYQSYAPSIEGGLDEVCYQARKEVSAAVQQIIELVKKTITKGIKKKHPEVRSYARPHTFMAEAPGRLRRRSMSIENDAVLVIDTSGSMWIPVLLDNMATLASQLTKKGLVSKTYCCDVALTPIDNIQRGEIKFTGAGGTAWTVEHNSQILKELYGEQLPEAPLTLYYCTDEMVEGLEQACLDERVNLVVINIPKILDEMTYLQASL